MSICSISTNCGIDQGIAYSNLPENSTFFAAASLHTAGDSITLLQVSEVGAFVAALDTSVVGADTFSPQLSDILMRRSVTAS